MTFYIHIMIGFSIWFSISVVLGLWLGPILKRSGAFLDEVGDLEGQIQEDGADRTAAVL